PEFAADINKCEMTFDRERRDDDALDQLMWIPFHYHAILASSRLTLIGVTTEVRRLARVFRYETPLHSGGKAGTPTASQTGRFGRFDYFCGSKFLDDFLRRPVAS